MSDRRDAAAALLQQLGVVPGLPDAEPRLTEVLTGPRGAEVAAALGEAGDADMATALVRLAPTITDRATQKALRRALFRLSQRGVAVPAAETPSQPAPALIEPEIDGLVSACDGRGDRVVWLLRALSSGSSIVVVAEINEPTGLRDVRVLDDVGRRQLRETRERLRRDTGLRLVPADWRALDALLVEADARAASDDRRRDYRRLRPRLTTAAPLSPIELHSTKVALPTAEEQAALVDAAVALLEEPEFGTWWPTREAIEPFVAEMHALRDSPLVLGRVQQEERVREVLARAADGMYPPGPVARRLEGTAYVLAETGRRDAARQALATAQALRTPRAGAIDAVPLVAALVQQSLGALFAAAESEREESRRGSLVLTPGELTARTSSRPGRTRA